jgi:hypothetical protein
MLSLIISYLIHIPAPPACASNRVFMECGHDCNKVCGTEEDCTYAECIEGCFCPDGTKWDGIQCVTADQCPCVRNQGPSGSDTYPLGSFYMASNCEQW